MCGITGILNLKSRPPAGLNAVRQMLEMIRHRGPDGFGVYRDDDVALGSARLSIIDLEGGDQPIGNEDESLWIVFNGEIFNYIELRPELEARGHKFRTQTDTEVILHLYEDYGRDCLSFLNGQFAVAIWDAGNKSLFLARDRLGIRPLFYTVQDGRLIFGSEIKSILSHPGIKAEIDPVALNEVFTFWSTLSPRSIFHGIFEVPPGHYLLAENGQTTVHSYWTLGFDQGAECSSSDCLEELEELLIDATRIRLRADVPVGAYLSGGLDSSTTTAIIRNYTNSRLDTFSISFADNPEFDESGFQRQMAGFLGTDHHVVECRHADIGRVFPEVVWHAETAVLRTSPAPMFLLSKLVNDNRFKVVMTGEGADEFLAGYDIFKEAKVRRFWAGRPESRLRPMLLRRIYRDIPGLGGSGEYLSAFFKQGLADTGSPYYSHAIRWNNTSRIRRFLRTRFDLSYDRIPLPPLFGRWAPLARSQYLEASIFLSEYLLSSQGDRMAMAHSVEGRFPFLDFRLVEFCNRLPPEMKLRGMKEKWLLKQLGRKLAPPSIWQRPKRPYRAPIHLSFFGDGKQDYVEELLSPGALEESGLFDCASVGHLVRKAASGARISETDEMAVAGILSTQLVYHRFVKAFDPCPIRSDSRIKLVDRSASRTVFEIPNMK